MSEGRQLRLTPNGAKRRLFGTIGDALLISGGLFAAACASFALIVRVDLEPDEKFVASVAVMAALSVMVGSTIAFYRRDRRSGSNVRENTSVRWEHLTDISEDVVAIVYHEPRRTFAEVDERISILLGVPVDRIHDRSLGLSDVVDEPEKSQIFDAVSATVSDGGRYRITYHVNCPGAGIRRIQETGVVIRRPRSGLTEILVALKDVTDSQSRDRKDRRLGAQVSVLGRLSPFGVLHLDRWGHVREANAVAKKVLAGAGKSTGVDSLFTSFMPVSEPDRESWSADSFETIAQNAPIMVHGAENTDFRYDLWVVPYPQVLDDEANAYAAFIHRRPDPEPARGDAVKKTTPVQRAPSPYRVNKPFLAVLEAEFRRARRFGSVFSLIVLRFTPSGGGILGANWDEALGQAVEDVCRERTRDVDMVGRMDRASFGILLPEAGRRTAQTVAERLRRGIREIIADDSDSLVGFVASIGVVRLRSDDRTSLALLNRCMGAAENAIKRGGDQIVLD